jgi:hypothetical protein
LSIEIILRFAAWWNLVFKIRWVGMSIANPTTSNHTSYILQILVKKHSSPGLNHRELFNLLCVNSL